MDVFLDRWNKTPRLDWNQTITNRIRESDFVLAVASPSYRAAAEGRNPRGANLGVQHELAIIRELLNGDRPTWLPRIIPVILPDWSIDDVPTVLQPTTANHCRIDEVTERGVTELFELLTGNDHDGRGDHEGRGDHDGRAGPPGRDTSVARVPVRARLTEVASRRSTVLTSVALVASAAIGVIVTTDFGSTEQNTTVSGSGNNVNQNSSGHCAQVVNGSCSVQLEEDLDRKRESATTDEELKAELARDAAENPVDFGSGPWPFMVVGTFVEGVNEGLYARTSNQITGSRVGTAPNRAVVWADCLAVSDFTPSTNSLADMGPQWLRIRWVPVQPNDRSVSEPGGTQRAWMYRGGVVPVKHDGEIPSCT